MESMEGKLRAKVGCGGGRGRKVRHASQSKQLPQRVGEAGVGEGIQVVECACQLESVKKKDRHSFEAEMVFSS